MTAPPKTLLSKLLKVSKTTPHLLASSKTVAGLPKDRRLKNWLSDAVLTAWSWTHSKQWRWLWSLGETFQHKCKEPLVIHKSRNSSKFSLIIWLSFNPNDAFLCWVSMQQRCNLSLCHGITLVSEVTLVVMSVEKGCDLQARTSVPLLAQSTPHLAFHLAHSSYIYVNISFV